MANVDAGGGWLIFQLPPPELGIHPAGVGEHPTGTHRISLMCDDINSTVDELTGRGVEFVTPVEDQGYGLTTVMAVPGGVELGLYEPRHPTAYDLEE